MAETNNFNKLCNIAMDSNSDILEKLTDGQIGRIKFDPEHVYVVYATDEMFSGWGMSKDRLNHVFVLCWSVEQAMQSIWTTQKKCSTVDSAKVI